MYEQFLQQIGATGRRAGLGLLGATLVLLVTGCAVPLRELPPPIEVPAEFSAAGKEPLPERWWHSFADPELDRLVDRALAGNLTLKSAFDRLRQAEAVARQAAAPLSPVLDAEGSAATSRSRSNGVTRSGEDFSLGLFAAYEIDLWGRLRANRDAALFDARATAEDLQAAALTLSALVAETWYSLAEQYGQLELLDLQIATNEKVLDLVTLRFRTGQVGIADVLQQRQLIESNRGEKARIEAQAEVLAHQLSILLGEAPGRLVTLGQPALIPLPPLPSTGVPAEMIERRPDLRRAWLLVRAADRDVAAAIADRFPRLSLAGRADTAGEARDLFSNWLTSLTANVFAPVLDGGRRRAEVERSRAAAAERVHAYGQQALDALGEVEDALAREEGLSRLLESLDRQLTLATQAVDVVRDRYLKGTVEYQRVLDALLSQQRLQQTVLTARAELIRTRIDLCRALAGGWEMTRELSREEA